MPVEIEAIQDFLRENMGKIIVSLGVVCIFVSVLFLTRAFQWVSSVSFLLGVALAVIGTVLHFESLRWKVPSLEGFGTILIYVSPLFFASAVVAATFGVPTGIVTTSPYGSSTAVDEHGTPFAWVSKASESVFIAVSLGRPSVWLVAPLMLTGLGVLIVGCFLKFVREVF